jgi:hypothetical protein
VDAIPERKARMTTTFLIAEVERAKCRLSRLFKELADLTKWLNGLEELLRVRNYAEQRSDSPIEVPAGSREGRVVQC